MKKKFQYKEVVRNLPNGHKARLQLIVHPGAVLIVPFLTINKVIMLRQYRAALEQYIYEFPAGTLDPEELPELCAERELMEETGYKARKMELRGKIYPVPGYSTEEIQIYQAEGLSIGTAQREADEVIETNIMTRSDVVKLFKAGKIHDAKTICAMAFCGIF